MKYELVIFDLDGTILDTLGQLTVAFNHALELSGILPVTKEFMRTRIGNGARNLVRLSIADVEGADEEKISADYREYYNSHCTENTEPFDGIKELLAELKRNGIRTAVVTNKSDGAAKKLCEYNFPGLLDVVRGHEEGIPHKPDPTIVNDIIRMYGISCEKTVIVGDSEVDILTAVNSNVEHISVTWGYKDASFLIANGATDMASDVMELRQLLMGEKL